MTACETVCNSLSPLLEGKQHFEEAKKE